MTRATARRARASIAVPALLAGLIAPSAAGAATVVVNAGFERSATADRAFTSQNDPLPISGWDFWDPQKLVAPVGDPLSGAATVLGTWTPPRQAYPAGAPEGSAVGFVYVAGGAGGGELGLRQLTRLRLAAGTRYLLNVAVGNPRSDDARGFSVAGFPGYRIELRAGGRLLAKEVDRVKPADGSFADTAIAFTAKASDRALGERIEIRLVNRNARAGAEVDFDRVRLATVRGGRRRGRDRHPHRQAAALAAAASPVSCRAAAARTSAATAAPVRRATAAPRRRRRRRRRPAPRRPARRRAAASPCRPPDGGQCASTGSALGSSSFTPLFSSSAETTVPTAKIAADHQNAVV